MRDQIQTFDGRVVACLKRPRYRLYQFVLLIGLANIVPLSISWWHGVLIIAVATIIGYMGFAEGLDEGKRIYSPDPVDEPPR